MQKTIQSKTWNAGPGGRDEFPSGFSAPLPAGLQTENTKKPIAKWLPAVLVMTILLRLFCFHAHATSVAWCSVCSSDDMVVTTKLSPRRSRLACHKPCSSRREEAQTLSPELQQEAPSAAENGENSFTCQPFAFSPAANGGEAGWRTNANSSIVSIAGHDCPANSRTRLFVLRRDLLRWIKLPPLYCLQTRPNSPGIVADAASNAADSSDSVSQRTQLIL